MPRLSKVDRNSCECILTEKECWEAFNPMKNRKSPGNDGLTKEFLLQPLISHLRSVSSPRQAVIVLTEKERQG